MLGLKGIIAAAIMCTQHVCLLSSALHREAQLTDLTIFFSGGIESQTKVFDWGGFIDIGGGRGSTVVGQIIDVNFIFCY